MPMEEFLYSTPIEIDYALKAYRDIREENDKAEWERTRTQVYYMYLLTPSKKKKVTYHQFKKDYLHLNYDDKLKESDEPIIDDATFERMQSYFKKKPEGAQ